MDEKKKVGPKSQVQPALRADAVARFTKPSVGMSRSGVASREEVRRGKVKRKKSRREMRE